MSQNEHQFNSEPATKLVSTGRAPGGRKPRRTQHRKATKPSRPRRAKPVAPPSNVEEAQPQPISPAAAISPKTQTVEPIASSPPTVTELNQGPGVAPATPEQQSELPLAEMLSETVPQTPEPAAPTMPPPPVAQPVAWPEAVVDLKTEASVKTEMVCDTSTVSPTTPPAMESVAPEPKLEVLPTPDRPSSLSQAIVEVKQIMADLQSALADMGEVLEILEQVEIDKKADEEEIATLREALSRMHRPQEPEPPAETRPQPQPREQSDQRRPMGPRRHPNQRSFHSHRQHRHFRHPYKGPGPRPEPAPTQHHAASEAPSTPPEAS